jgi:YHS domain-containing protein
MRGVRYVAAAIVLGLSAMAGADDTAFKGDPYTLDVCAVSGEPLGSMGEPVVLVHEGRDIKFCCSGCNPRFTADPAAILSKVDTQMIADQKPHYPLTTDIVTGEALPADDKVIDVVHFNRLVRFGSQKSAQTFMKDPDTYITKLNEAVIAKQKDSYPIDKCVVSGEILSDTDFLSRVYANRLVEFCCDHCVDSFVQSPAKYLRLLEKGEAAAEGSASHEHHEK